MSIFIIGEIGINHNGDLKGAKDLIDVAIDSELLFLSLGENFER